MGLIMAAMIASLMSSADSGLNSMATILTNDYYHRWLDRQATEKRLVLVGRFTSVFVLVIAVTRALTMEENESLMQFLQMGLAYVAAPVVVVFLGGLFWRGATSVAAVVTLIAAPLVCYLCQTAHRNIDRWPEHMVYWLPIAVGILAVLLVVVSLFTPRKSAKQLESVIWTFRSATSLEGPTASGEARGRLLDYRLWAAVALVLMALQIWWLW